MKCQILFSRKNKKNISKCRLLKFLPSMQGDNFLNIRECSTEVEKSNNFKVLLITTTKKEKKKKKKKNY